MRIPFRKHPEPAFERVVAQALGFRTGEGPTLHWNGVNRSIVENLVAIEVDG